MALAGLKQMAPHSVRDEGERVRQHADPQDSKAAEPLSHNSDSR